MNDPAAAPTDLAMAVNGQTLVLDAILLFLAVVMLPQMIGLAILRQTTTLGLALCGVMLGLLSVLGVVRIVVGMRLSLPASALRIFLALIPLLNLISFIALSVEVSKRVEQAGYQGGLLGVRAAQRRAIAAATPGQPEYSRMPSVLVTFAIVLICIFMPA